MATTKRTEKRTATTEEPAEAFTQEERAAIKERAKEVRAAKAAAAKGTVDEEAALLEKVAEMADSDRAMAERIHAVIRASAPELTPRLWYGMPAYAKDGKVVCFFQAAAKFKSRYATLGFNDAANLDDGTVWPIAYALTRMTEVEEAKVAELVKRAVR